ncbi:CidA/LrgA family protein [Isoptericola sp. AK164]|uniref:CidA/LrgA family protein n=1 Tax=Isoptericola sp. AK164 TaxID=3024246 RepID=UPI002418171B|nr:CidA/LrgA family protein [Isoptericola sp. AK164]
MSADSIPPPRTVARAVAGLAVLYGLYAVGAVLSSAVGWPVPGGIIGMVLLLALLRTPWGERLERCLGGIGAVLVALLPLLLVPVAVGVVAELTLLRQQWWVVGLTVAASWVVAVTVVAAVSRWTFARRRA